MKRHDTFYALRNADGKFFNYHSGKLEDDLAFNRHIIQRREKADELCEKYSNPNWHGLMEVVEVIVTMEAP